ncbi:MAG: glycosyltransferase family 9 protein [Flavobacteriales bacterium]|nr:glycosyltransferase family 9 protein [Flavobacteriales bacterium]
MFTLRKQRYDLVVNLQRFASSGMLTWAMKSKNKRGFTKNPLAFVYSQSFDHRIGEKGETDFQHEIERNHAMIEQWVGPEAAHPRLNPEQVNASAKLDTIFASAERQSLIVMAPASVWFTKMYAEEKWVELVEAFKDHKVALIGAPSDGDLLERIIKASTHTDIHNLAGKLSLLESAQLMKEAKMSYVNDSAPLHLASSVDAPVTAIFCSTIPEFGFGPVGENSRIVQSPKELACRPCGLHGRRSCPQVHFQCALSIRTEDLTEGVK